MNRENSDSLGHEKDDSVPKDVTTRVVGGTVGEGSGPRVGRIPTSSVGVEEKVHRPVRA